MKILVMSDSHSANILNHNYLGYDYIFHCGDINQNDYYYLSNYTGLFVQGNCDYYSSEPLERIITIKDKKILITHGQLFHVKSSIEYLVEHAKSKGVDIVFYGHTHERYYNQISGITFINPGAYNDGAYVEITDNAVTFYEEPTGLNDKPIIYETINIKLFE